MGLDPAVAAFRDWMLREYRPDGRYDRVVALEGPGAGAADLAVRLECGPKSYYEARVDLERAELQVGFATESRVLNEEIEQSILDAGGDLSELLGDELCDLGEEPLPMEHFFERPAFRYIVRLPLSNPRELEEERLRQRVKRILQACRILFQDAVDSV